MRDNRQGGTDRERDEAAHGYEDTTPGVERSGIPGTVLDPRMGGDPVTADDVPTGPNAGATGSGTGGAAGNAGGGGERPFDPSRAYAGTDPDPGEMTGVGGVPGGIGAPGGHLSHGLAGAATGGLAGGTAASPGSGSAGGIGGSMPSASQMQTVAGGGAIPGAEADVRADAGGHLGGLVGAGPADPSTGAGAGGAANDRTISGSSGGHGGVDADLDQGANADALNPVLGTSGMNPEGGSAGA